MDKKTAFEILNLDATVSFEDAKKAYRKLAKKYHPDVVGKNSWPKRNAEAKMKEINLAFRYIAPLLRSNQAIKKTKEKKYDTTGEDKSIKHEKDMIFSFLSKIFGLLSAFLNKKIYSRAFNKNVEKEKFRPPDRSTDRKRRFDDIFHNVYNISSDRKRKAGKFKKKRRSQKNSPYIGYQKFMVLKRKMKSGQSDPNMSIGKIDKIDPVKRVNPIGNK
ncbi:MAG: DnaJ domain-containing protein [Desulfobacula sp.]|nr:DnaJ domain-containing protein [Desulfobacula sp.]